MLFDEAAEFFKLAGGLNWIDTPRYNIAPSLDVSVVRVAKGAEELREIRAIKNQRDDLSRWLELKRLLLFCIAQYRANIYEPSWGKQLPIGQAQR